MDVQMHVLYEVVCTCCVGTGKYAYANFWVYADMRLGLMLGGFLNPSLETESGPLS